MGKIKTVVNHNEPDVMQHILKNPSVLGLGQACIKKLSSQDATFNLYDLLILDIEKGLVLLGCYLNKTLNRNDYKKLRKDWLYMRDNYEGRELPLLTVWKTPFERGACIIADGFSKQFISLIQKSDISLPCILFLSKEEEGHIALKQILNTTQGKTDKKGCQS
jgi:hypothetical protein